MKRPGSPLATWTAAPSKLGSRRSPRSVPTARSREGGIWAQRCADIRDTRGSLPQGSNRAPIGNDERGPLATARAGRYFATTRVDAITRATLLEWWHVEVERKGRHERPA